MSRSVRPMIGLAQLMRLLAVKWPLVSCDRRVVQEHRLCWALRRKLGAFLSMKFRRDVAFRRELPRTWRTRLQPDAWVRAPDSPHRPITLLR